jgi:hypothetical protein
VTCAHNPYHPSKKEVPCRLDLKVYQDIVTRSRTYGVQAVRPLIKHVPLPSGRLTFHVPDGHAGMKHANIIAHSMSVRPRCVFGLVPES